MRAWLKRNGFPEISKHTVDRLMRETGIKGLVRGRRIVTAIRAKDKIRAKDLLNRNFFTDMPNKVCITNFTDVPTGAGFTYVSFVIDLFSRRILFWATSISHDTAFAEEALQMALWRCRHGSESRNSPIQRSVHRSDAGNNYTCGA